MSADPDRDLDEAERARIAPYVSNLDGPVFALTNLPEVVKAALFARYSRSPKSLRRLLVDEFLDDEGGFEGPARAGHRRAAELFDRVFFEYGDDSVAQLGGAHIAVEGISNVMTKVLQWGRLASYLEQSTRYISFAEPRAGRYRYHRPRALSADPELSARYERVLDDAFERYGRLYDRVARWVDGVVPDVDPADAAARRRAVNARALDAVRGLLPAATTANVGVFASGQAYEAMLVRLRAHPLPEARDTAERMLRELRTVIPSFLTRVDREDRGVRHGAYLAELDRSAARLVDELLDDHAATPDGARVTLVDFDPDAERRVLAHALWPHSGRDLDQVRAQVAQLDSQRCTDALRQLAGERGNRRHKPGRALENAQYSFEIVCDYGAYRDLQRHRMLTLQTQPLTPHLGYDVPGDVHAAGCADDFAAAQQESAELYDQLAAHYPAEAPYAVTLAHRVRFCITLNAREAMHLIELRSQPSGHESYRAVAREMHRQIASVAGHEAIAAMMSFVDDSAPAVGRLEAEQRSERRRGGRG